MTEGDGKRTMGIADPASAFSGMSWTACTRTEA